MILGGLAVMHVGLGDPRLVNYTLEHGYRWLSRVPAHASFWNAPLFHPHPNVSAFTDTLLGLGPFYWPWRLLGAAPDTAFQLWMLSVWSLNFFAAYLLLRRSIGARVPGASLGAYVFAFGSRQLNYFAHQQLVPLFYVVLGVVALFWIFGERVTDKRRRAGIVLLALVVVLQAYSAYYPLFSFGLLLVAAGGLALLLPRCRARLHVLRGHALLVAASPRAASSRRSPSSRSSAITGWPSPRWVRGRTARATSHSRPRGS
jgi:hypothetical protein